MFRVCAVAVALAFGTGCASIISGSTQLISVNSSVSGADVYLGGQLLGKTPYSGEVERGAEGQLTVKAPGYQDFSFAINKSINSVFWLNIFTGGTLGSSTDYSTGAMYEYEPSTFFAELIPLNASAEESERLMKVAAMRRFLLMNSEPLVRQLAVGEGTYLESLFRGLEVADSDRESTLQSWRAVYAESTTAVDFSNRMLETMAL